MKFGSVCSGIEAASVAWNPLGWEAAWFAEIEPFPSAVLAHHYPHVPNLGDMTTIARRVLSGEVEAPDLLCGGTPCQAFSVAGLRKSLDDDRGNLTLKFVELADAIDHVRVRAGLDPADIFWENVPGVLSTKDNAFGCFLAGLAGEDEPLQPPGGKWAIAGWVYGPKRAIAWRTLDAQYFGLAQRRRRVFVVASAGDRYDPVTVLFEWDGVRRDIAPSRQAGQDPAGCPSSRTDGGGFPGTDEACSGYVHPVAGTLGCRSADHPSGLKSESDFIVAAFGGNKATGPIDVATALNACASASGRMDFETETFLVQETAHTLRGEGFDASEDGTGRGTPLVPVLQYDHACGECGHSYFGAMDAHCPKCGSGFGAIHGEAREVLRPVTYSIQAGALRTNPESGPDGVGVQVDHAYTLEARAEVQCVAFDTTQVTSKANRSNPKPGDPCHPLAAGAHPPAIAFECKASGMAGFGVGDIASTMRAMGHVGSHGNGGGQLAVAYTTKLHNTQSNQSGKVYEEYATSLSRSSPPPALLTAMQVRRLTPTECERLQGFPQVVAKLIFDVCIDHQSSCAHVAIQCHKSLSSASPVGASESMQRASIAGPLSSTSQADREPLAALRVRMHSEDELLELRSLGRLVLSANGAAIPKEYLPPTLNANTVQELAQLSRDLASSVGLGRVESLPSISLSMPEPHGGRPVQTSIGETEGCVTSAANALSAERFTTLSLGRFAPTCDSTTATLFCCVVRAIAGSIPETTLSGSFSFEIEVSTPYTAIPWRNKPVSECPDGPRYKALGNSWATHVVNWLGRRLAKAKGLEVNQ